jgi:hypothetical protein
MQMDIMNQLPHEFQPYDPGPTLDSIYRAKVTQRQERAAMLEQMSVVDDKVFAKLLAEFLCEDPTLELFLSNALVAHVAVRKYRDGKAGR